MISALLCALCVPKNRETKKTLYFKFGKPLAVESKGRRAHECVVEFIAGSLKDWGVAVRGDFGIPKSEGGLGNEGLLNS